MADKDENQEKKYTKIFEEFRSNKTESNLQKIYKDLLDNKSNLLDNDIIPFQFSNNIIWLLSNNIIDLKIQSDIFKLYIDAFFTFKVKPENLQKLTLLEQIFKYDSFLYKNIADTEDLNCFIKKYFDKYYPKKKKLKIEKGEILDVFIEEKDLVGDTFYGWTQLPIKRIEKNYVIFNDYDDENKELQILIDSYKIQERYRFISKEEMDWRKELKRGEKIDFFNNRRLWVEADLLNVISNNAVISPLGGPQGDNAIRSIYSPLIRPLNTFSFKYDENEKNYFPLLYYNSYSSKFNYIFPKPKIIEGQDTNFLLPATYLSYHCLFFYDIFNYFINKLISGKYFEPENEDNLSIEYIYKILDILNKGFEILNQLFFGDYFNDIIFPRIKNILLKISVDKKKNISKNMIDKIFEISNKFINLKYYIFQIPKVFLEFYLKFGFNCFKESENLEKRLIGLNSILSGLQSLDIFDHHKIHMNEYDMLIYQNFLNDNNDLFQLLFSKSDIHEQLILKGKEIAITLYKRNMLDYNDINKLYNYAISSQEGTENCKQLYSLLTEISRDMSLNLSQIMINKIITFPFEQIRRDDVYLIFSIIQYMKNEKEYKQLIKTALDYIYEYIITDIDIGKNYISEFTRTISYLQNEDSVFFASYYIEKIINELLKKKNWRETEFFYDFLSYFILSFKPELKNTMKSKFVLYLNYNNNSQKLLNNIFQNIEDNTEKISLDIKIEHIIAILDSIKSILFFSEYKIFFTTDSIMKLCDIFLFTKKKPSKQAEFLRSLTFFKRNYLINIEEFCVKFFKKFDLYLSEINKENYIEYYDIIDDEYAEMVLKFYETINKLEQNTENDEGIITENCFIKKNPLKLQYFEIVWKMFTKINQNNLMEEFLSNFSLRLFTPKERHEIWEIIIKKIFDEEENFIEQKIALNMINSIISNSEIFGTGGVISLSLEKIKKFPLKLSIKSKFEPFPDIDLDENIYTTSTIYEVKKEIQNKLGIDPIFIEFTRFNNYDITSNMNGKILCFILNLQNNSSSSLVSLTKEQLEKKYTLTMRKSSEFYRMKKYKLTDNDNPSSFNEKTISVFKNIFNESTHGSQIMDRDTYKDYYLKCTGLQNVEALAWHDFSKYDHDNKGFWDFDNFIEFYFDTFKENKIYQIFSNFNNFGYRNDLELVNTPLDKSCPIYYEENNKYEYMPRYFIGNNMDYMNKLFTFSLSNDKSVHELAQKIIKELSTMEQMKNLIFEKNKENEKIIDDLLQKDNLEMRTYAFNIILSELEKYNESNNQEIQLSIINFIQKNLDKIVNDFDNYMNIIKIEINNNRYFNNKENTQFIQFLNYYHVNIQIILFSLKRLINDLNLFELIQKFDDDFEDKEKSILSTVSSLKINEDNLNILKNINIEKIFNIIISYLLLQREQIKTVLYDLKFSYHIIILIFILLKLNIHNNEIKENIYINYIFNIVNLSKSPLIRCKKFLQYSNEFILILNKSDKNFSSMIKEETTKEILKHELLNRPLLTKNFIFIIYKDIINILIRKDEISDSEYDSLFEFLKSIINIISDKKVFLREVMITNYLEILSLVMDKLKEVNSKLLYEYDFDNLLLLLINNCLINTKNNFNKNYSKYNDKEYIGTLFELIEKIISINPNKYIFTFFNNDDIKNLKIKHLSKLPDDKGNYDPKLELKNSTNYLGLKNLSSLCYMNSVLQQFYMIPIFKKSILNLKANNNEYKLNEKEDLDDLLFQLTKMFYYLTYSDKSYYNPKQFVFSFKDYDGNPTNPNVQCDAQEFLTRFVEKLEEQIKNTCERFLWNNILGGTTLQQIICTNTDCKNISERRESVIYLSLDIKGNRLLEDCLDKFVSEEKIEDYHCEKCDKKITHIKKVLIDKLPNILILHLQRIAFNYETFLMEKINDEIAFDKELNIKRYTTDKYNHNIKFENYEYKLIGVIIHGGTAQYGHYYSVIYSQDKRSENKWYKFNDTAVTETTYDNMKKDIENYNNNNREYNPSPYMLLYQKKIKNPVLVNIREINENENISNLLQDDKNSIIEDNGIKYEIYKDVKDAIEKNKYNEKNDKEIILKDNKLIGHLINYDDALNYLNKISENNKEENIPFKSVILEENIQFCNDKKIYSSSFTNFINNITEEIKKEIEKDNNIAEKYLPIIKLLNDYLFNILSISWYKEGLKSIIDNMTYILKYMPSMISYLIKDILEPKKEIFLHDYLLYKDKKLSEAFSNYFAKILIISIENNIENEIALQIINYYMEKIPVEISKKWSEMEHFNNFILILVENSEKIKKKFLSEDIISKLIDFILEKESPLYKGDERFDNKNINGKLGPLVRSIAYLYEYYLTNKEKDDTLKLSEQDEKMINYMPFYEKIILDNYDEKGSSILINLKLSSSLNLNESINKNNLDLLIKLKVPTSKSVDGIISSLSLIEKLFETFKEEKEKEKKELLNIIFGIPTLLVESGEAKICYVSGGYFNYYSILNNISIKKEINEDTIPLLFNIFKLLNNFDDIYEYINKLPAPNSHKYTYLKYLIKLYIETRDKINSKDNNIKYDKKIYDELNTIMQDFCKKYNINLEDIKNDNNICIRKYMCIYRYEAQLITSIPNLKHEIINNINNYKDKIKVFHIIFFYQLTDELNKVDFDFFTEKKEYLFHKGSHNNKTLEKLNLEKYYLEALFIQGNKDCNLSFSIEPIIYSNMKISIKKINKYFLFVKDYNLPINENKDENLIIDVDLFKLKINDIEKDKNEVPNLPESNKLQVNEDAFVINCPICGTPNAIDENNQNLVCYFCSAALL